MPRPPRLSLIHAALFFLTCWVACGIAPGRAVGREGTPQEGSSETRDLVKAVNALASADIPIDAAQATACDVKRLPASLAKLLPLMPREHRELIHECARGRVSLGRGLVGFDLVQVIDDPAEHPEAVATIRSFFSSRAVDVASGTACSDDPYPIRFDWLVVHDVTSRTLFSFIVNCQD